MRLVQFSILLVFALTVIVALGMPTAIAESTTTVTPINDKVSLKKTVIAMHIPEDNIFPWGSVRGAASDYAERYPVIIQIYKGEYKLSNELSYMNNEELKKTQQDIIKAKLAPIK